MSFFARFRRQRLGLLGGLVLLMLALVVAFAGFFSPYDPQTQHRQFPYVPPMLGRLHFRDEEGFHLRPFVYGLERVRDPFALDWVYVEDKSEKYPVYLFVRGEEYRLLGLFKTDIHLFGTGTEGDSPGQLFLLGTDKLGRDLLARVLAGGQISLGLGLLVVLVCLVVGVLIGGFSGYYGGAVDTLLQRSVEVVMSIPRLALLLALSAALPPELPATTRFWGIAVVLALVGWAPLARVIRGQFLRYREEEFILAARANGSGSGRIIFRHILPNTFSYLIVAATLTAPALIILESILSFFNFGIQEPLISWGMLLQEAQSVFQLQFHPWLLLPAGCIVLVVLAFNFLGDALRDAVDPHLTLIER
ncbi:MAG: ABC transporter permease [Candidatus Acetothermia bacterium]|jgi:peptide/nickel transport system permease protein|nr:ABC transporter permease [Candidatus Acetothermia bacterium]MDH7504577.1 ABC transporter permease [Candidatus Acetothermia bacterium]